MSEYKVLDKILAAELEKALNHLASEWKPVLFLTTAAGGNSMIVATVILEKAKK